MKATIFSKMWWQASGTPRWVLAVGAVSTIGLTVLANTVGTMHVENQKRIDAGRSEQVRMLLSDLAQYQSAVATFAEEMRDAKKASPATRTALIKNLNDQVSHARQIEALLPSDKGELDALRHSINHLIQALPDNYDHEAMNRFWTAVGEVTANRNKLNRQLQQSI